MNHHKFIKERLIGMDYHEFYNVAAYFLDITGYKNISIVDGKDDKGTDVTTSNTGVQIQLSVNKKWKDKINSTLDNAHSNNSNILFYITNQKISPEEQNEFQKTRKYQDTITLLIADIDRVSTELSLPQYLKRSYELLKIEEPITIEATQEDIAISNILLLSKEAIDLREHLIETRILTCIYMKVCTLDKKSIISHLIQDNFDERMLEKSFSKLQQEQKIIVGKDNVALSEEQFNIFEATKFQYELEIQDDKEILKKEFNISDNIADEIIKLALEISILRKIDSKLSSNHQHELPTLKLDKLINSNGLNKRRTELYKQLASLNFTKIQQYKNTLEYITKEEKEEKEEKNITETTIAKIKKHATTVQYVTNTTTYDIYRILQRNTKIKIVLDTSVAMPMLFALELGDNNTKFVKTAKYLLELAKKHNFELIVPAPYINEFAGHGFSICDLSIYEEIINNKDRTFFDVLKGSQNAFISFYANFSNKDKLSIIDFLEHFGISLKNRDKQRYQTQAINTIYDLFTNHGINIIQLNYDINNNESYNTIKELIDERKLENPNYHRSDFLIKNDANVCTYLKQQTDSGYIFATWDNIISQALERVSRIYANIPPKVMDLLSFCGNLDFTMDVDMYTTLLFSNEEKLMRLAEKIESVKSINEFENKMELTKIIRNQRDFKEADWLDNREVIDEVLNLWE